MLGVGLIGLLIYVVIIGLLFYIIDYLVGQIPMPAPPRQALRVLMALILILIVLQLFGVIPERWQYKG